jgi:hypothetical protein
VRADSGDEGLIDATCQDHQGGIACFGVGDAEAGDEFTFLAHLSKGAGQLHTAAVDDRNLIPIGDEVGNGFAGRVKNLLIFKGRTAQFDNKSHSKPSSSFHPHIKFMFCTA